MNKIELSIPEQDQSSFTQGPHGNQISVYHTWIVLWRCWGMSRLISHARIQRNH